MIINKKTLKTVFILAGSLLVLASAFVSFVLYETQDEIDATPDNIAEKLASFYNENKMAGFAVSVFDADQVYYQGGVGFADREQNIPYTSQTLQYTASVCKTTLGICLLKAQELGYLSLKDPVNKHLPFEIENPHFPESDISIEQLATHTSSLAYNEAVVESLYVDEADKSQSLQGFMEDYFVKEKYGEISYTEHVPGTNWNYSNIGAGLAAYLIEHTSGMSYAKFCQKFLFDPLGMKQSAWFRSELDSSLITQYYEPTADEKLEKVAAKGVILYPARDLITNVEDLTRYAQAILRRDPKILTADSYEKMLSPALNSSVSGQEADNHGIFWMIDRNQYGITYQMTGMNGGDYCINTMMWLDLKTEMGYIFLGNTGVSEASHGNHIRIFRALVSLGDRVLMENPQTSPIDKLGYIWHNLSSRVGALF